MTDVTGYFLRRGKSANHCSPMEKKEKDDSLITIPLNVMV